ncbi:hypothetical protein niasHT_005136 [Heterodera trifolii]|uniref:Protein kinase domain-containing protein n=1 Tax=Heterodera trifolii TaxID=157864 RepID=A0ABD2M7X7_9BILA
MGGIRARANGRATNWGGWDGEQRSGEAGMGHWHCDDEIGVGAMGANGQRHCDDGIGVGGIFASAFVNPVLAVVNQPPQLIVISQFMPFGSLYNVLHEQSSVVIDHHQAIRFALDLARGMSFLHSLDQPVLRYYLSSKHVLIDEDLSAKISMADTKFSFQEVGRLYSPAWMAPEALQRSPESLNTRASDMWSFGILLWELNTREVPFSDLSPMEIGMKIALEGLRVTIPPGISRNMFRLINICLNEDPGRRPNFDQIIPILEKMGH